MRKLIKTIAIELTLVSLLVVPQTVAAISGPAQKALNKTKTAGTKAGLGEAAVETTIGSLIQYVLSIVGIILLILIIYGGVMWMTARGNEEQVKKARNILRNAIIGVIIVFMAYAISDFVFSSMYEAAEDMGEAAPDAE